jgi:hypothetical protein
MKNGNDMKTNLLTEGRVSSVERRALDRAATRPAGAPVPVPVRHLAPHSAPGIHNPPQQPVTPNGRLGSGQPATLPIRCSLKNTAGFWELTFDGRAAVLKQHPALFYVACLLAKAPAEPLAALDLAAAVFKYFRAHSDLLICVPWLCRQQSDADVARAFRRKLRALEKILDHPGRTDVEKAEAEREVIYLEHLLATYFVELIPPGEETAARIATDLLDLYASLAAARDALGNPHRVIRAFALHLLICVVMPSVRASRGKAGARYVYRR